MDATGRGRSSWAHCSLESILETATGTDGRSSRTRKFQQAERHRGHHGERAGAARAQENRSAERTDRELQAPNCSRNQRHCEQVDMGGTSLAERARREKQGEGTGKEEALGAGSWAPEQEASGCGAGTCAVKRT
jgi:hypothetical protein